VGLRYGRGFPKPVNMWSKYYMPPFPEADLDRKRSSLHVINVLN
jgi:hypothetical protein